MKPFVFSSFKALHKAALEGKVTREQILKLTRMVDATGKGRLEEMRLKSAVALDPTASPAERRKAMLSVGALYRSIMRTAVDREAQEEAKQIFWHCKDNYESVYTTRSRGMPLRRFKNELPAENMAAFRLTTLETSIVDLERLVREREDAKRAQALARSIVKQLDYLLRLIDTIGAAPDKAEEAKAWRAKAVELAERYSEVRADMEAWRASTREAFASPIGTAAARLGGKATKFYIERAYEIVEEVLASIPAYLANDPRACGKVGFALALVRALKKHPPGPGFDQVASRLERLLGALKSLRRHEATTAEDIDAILNGEDVAALREAIDFARERGREGLRFDVVFSNVVDILASPTEEALDKLSRFTWLQTNTSLRGTDPEAHRKLATLLGWIRACLEWEVERGWLGNPVRRPSPMLAALFGPARGAWDHADRLFAEADLGVPVYVPLNRLLKLAEENRGDYPGCARFITDYEARIRAISFSDKLGGVFSHDPVLALLHHLPRYLERARVASDLAGELDGVGPLIWYYRICQAILPTVRYCGTTLPDELAANVMEAVDRLADAYVAELDSGRDVAKAIDPYDVGPAVDFDFLRAIVGALHGRDAPSWWVPVAAAVAAALPDGCPTDVMTPQFVGDDRCRTSSTP